MAAECLLYYITDRTQFSGDESARRGALLHKVSEAAAAGVTYIQLREKDLCARDLERLAREAVNAIRTSGNDSDRNSESRTKLLINSRTDVAIAAEADGVHLRSKSKDVSPADVRSVLKNAMWQSRKFVIAVSCHTAAETLHAESDAADFAVFAPVFGKRGVAEIQPSGLDALGEACRAKIPILALGGVTVENAASCLDAGAAGVAGIRLFQENRIEDVVRSLRAL